jgi:hypothetical protein
MKAQILSAMRLKTTEELIEIWRENDLTKWRKEAIDVVKELLLERLENLPEQNEPVGAEKIIDVKDFADSLLKDYLTKTNLGFLLESILEICLYLALFLFIAAAGWVYSMETNTKIIIDSLWVVIIATV